MKGEGKGGEVKRRAMMGREWRGRAYLFKIFLLAYGN